jgi:hypothetical protein
MARNGTTTLAYLMANYPNIGWEDYLAGLLPGRKLDPNGTKVQILTLEKNLHLLNEFMGQENALSYMYAGLFVKLLSKVGERKNYKNLLLW